MLSQMTSKTSKACLELTTLLTDTKISNPPYGLSSAISAVLIKSLKISFLSTVVKRYSHLIPLPSHMHTLIVTSFFNFFLRPFAYF